MPSSTKFLDSGMSIVSVASLYSVIREDMARVDTVLNDRLSRELTPSIRKMNAYLLASPGKRLRPALVMLYYQLLSKPAVPYEDAVKIAVSIELIHMASLVHDDIIDGASTRHNQPSFFAKFGMEQAVSMGVYLYSLSLKLISEVGHIGVLQSISLTVKQLCRGEMGQVSHRDDLGLSIPRYLVLLKKKTGVLFGAACESGLLLAGGDPSLARHAKAFGSNLGVAFQIMDDYMDIMGNREELKKDPGQDFLLGEYTLPVLYLIEAYRTEGNTAALGLFHDRKAESIVQIQADIRRRETPILRTRELALFYLDKARQALCVFPDSRHLNALYSLLDYVQKRGL